LVSLIISVTVGGLNNNCTHQTCIISASAAIAASSSILLELINWAIALLAN
jgi:hypothetical protein